MLQTVDVDVKVTVEVAAAVECLPACGSSSCFAAAAAEMVSAADAAMAAAAEMTAACGSSYCLFSAADAAEIAVDATTAAATAADANTLT